MDSIPYVVASEPLEAPPAWAVLERHLLDLLSQAVPAFLAKVADEHGELIWDGEKDARGDIDDFYESFTGWSMLYLLGGDSTILDAAHREWEAVTAQLGRGGYLLEEYEPGYDWFHQSESYQVFVQLCLADPDDTSNRDRAKRFAAFLTSEKNFDQTLCLFRAPHIGSAGPQQGFFGAEADYAAQKYPFMRSYGLPFPDIDGVQTFDDLLDPILSRRFGEAMDERFGEGDVANNLYSTMLAGNAFGLTGEPAYGDWIIEYLAVWAKRAHENGGLIPDNIGLDGVIGSNMRGRWYGGLYGWTWPHGIYSLLMATLVAGSYATLTTGETAHIALARQQIDPLLPLGKVIRRGDLTGTLHWDGQVPRDEDADIFVIPHRFGDDGWFDFQPVPIESIVNMWFASYDDDDAARLKELRRLEPTDWRTYLPSRNKHDGGHERPWLMFLEGENDGYPCEALSQAESQVGRRLNQINAADDAWKERPPPMRVHIWQELNPVTTEALLHLTMGAPQPVYNGGPLHASLRYFDALRKQSGLPPDVAALVTRITAGEVFVELVNLSPMNRQEVIIQAGAYAEHNFTGGKIHQLVGLYPGRIGAYEGPIVETDRESFAIDGPHLRVALPPLTRAHLELEVSRYQRPMTYRLPW